MGSEMSSNETKPRYEKHVARHLVGMHANETKETQPANPGANGKGTPSEKSAHAGSRTRVTSMGGLYDAVTLHAR